MELATQLHMMRPRIMDVSTAHVHCMATKEVMECAICQEFFDEGEHQPLFLPCSHSICKNCVDGLIRYKNLQCPVCRRDFQASSLDDLPTNRGLLDAMKYIKHFEARIRQSYEGWQSLQREEEVELQKIKSEIVKLVQIDETLINELQKFNEIAKEIVISNENLVKNLTEHKERLQIQMKDVIKKDQEINSVQVTLKSASNFTEAGPFMDEISSIMKDLRETLPDTKFAINANCELLKESNKQSERNLKCLLEIQSLLKSSGGDINALNTRSTIKEEPLEYLTVDEMGKATGEIYCVTLVNGKRMYKKIVKDEEDSKKLYVSSKNEQIIPSTAKFVKLEYLKKDMYLQTYMDLSHQGKPVGRIIFDYRNSANYSDHINNHIKLCTGELGPSFINTNVIEVKNIGKQDEYVVFGDYEKNDGTGGKSLLGRELESSVVVPRRICYFSSYGLVVLGSSQATASQFGIQIEERTFDCFGEVVQGGNILKSAIQKYENPRDIKISDCGLIVSPDDRDE